MKNDHDLNGKTVLLIGSGRDIDGRAMQERIDTAGEFDLIARVNKPYGASTDAGTRTDIIFVRRAEWVNLLWGRRPQQGEDAPAPRMVAFRDAVGCERGYAEAAAQELGLPKVSTGLLAAKWLLERGAAVSVIGFGATGGAFAKAKTYAVTGAADNNPNYNWPAENEWLAAHVTLL